MSLCDNYISFEESGSSSEQSWLSQEKRFLKVVNEFSLALLGITHWKRAGPVVSPKLKSPSPKNA